MLYFISTPIGNLKDITIRAIETLEAVDIIACEDTRHSIKLLNHYEIKKPLISYHKFNERQSAENIIKLLKEGKEIAVISDAGTPLISDPGSVLTKMLIEQNLGFTTIPGANALLPALILSGLDTERFTFIGFLPEKKKEREQLLASIKDIETSLIFYIAPHDLMNNIQYLCKVLGDRRASAVREITKLHESATYFNLGDNLEDLTIKGEFVLIVEGGKKQESPLLNMTINEHIDHYLEQGLDKKQALKQVAKDRNVAKSTLYKYTIDM